MLLVEWRTLRQEPGLLRERKVSSLPFRCSDMGPYEKEMLFSGLHLLLLFQIMKKKFFNHRKEGRKPPFYSRKPAKTSTEEE